MATGTLILPIGAAIPSAETTSGSAPPAISRTQGSEVTPKKHFLIAGFDAAADEHLYWSFRMPADYASGPVAKLQWMANATTGTCRWGVQLAAVTPADVDTPVEHAFATTNTAGTATNATEARRLNETSITLTNADSVAAGDLVVVRVYRDADGTSGTDDLAVDAELVAVSIEYTTS